MSSSDEKLTHINEHGGALMVDVSGKPITRRTATATARITMNSVAFAAIKNNTLAKGEAIGTSRIAGIMAAKRTSDLIPLCHALPISSVEIQFQFAGSSVIVTATAVTDAKTGVEMEALTACTLSALTLYDMAKALDRSMTISDIKLLHKAGGQNGEYKAKE
jgi:cyclic pyranopterin phosphate synthase